MDKFARLLLSCSKKLKEIIGKNAITKFESNSKDIINPTEGHKQLDCIKVKSSRPNCLLFK